MEQPAPEEVLRACEEALRAGEELRARVQAYLDGVAATAASAADCAPLAAAVAAEVAQAFSFTSTWF